MLKEINKNTPIDYHVVKKYIELYDSVNIGQGNTRILMRMIDGIEKETSDVFIRMEIGIPGIKPSRIGIDAEIQALQNDVAGTYPPAGGHPALKKEISRFTELFLNINVPEEYCIPTVGAVNGCYAALMVACRRIKDKNKVLFIDPGFPAHKNLVKMLGFPQESFDIYNFRGSKLRAKLEQLVSEGDIAAVIYSNPNNPAWICLTEEELEIIGKLATEYDFIVMEDLSYFGMDFRKDYSHPGVQPFQPTVANYTDKYIIMCSASKSFSYAGQSIGMIIVAEALFKSRYKNLHDYYLNESFGNSIIFGAILLTTGGVAQSVQYGMAEMLKAANDGRYNFIDEVRIYGYKAKLMKEIFIENGFSIVYDKDGQEGLADGFYFTVAFPGFQGDELSERLLYYGISSIPLTSTGSERSEGIRACVSLVSLEQLPELRNRLKLFNQHYC